MSTSPKKSQKSKSKQKNKEKQQKKSTKLKDKEKDTKQKKSKDQRLDAPSEIQNVKHSAPSPSPPLGIILQTNEHICHFHREANYSFCQTCEQLACQQCVQYGPHQSQIHKIVTVQQCYRSRYLYLKQLIYNDLLRKRQELGQRLKSLNCIVEELKYNKQVIQRQINIQFNQVLERLKVAFGGKLAVLYNAMAQLQKQLECLNSVGQQFFNLTNLGHNQSAETNPKGLVPFLLRSRYLQDEAENLIAFPISQQVNIYPYDLPREVNQKKMMLERAKQNDPTKEFKFEVICNLLKSNENTANSLESQFFDQANLQKQQWIKITNELKDKLSRFDKICHFCGVPLSRQSMNSQCSRNVNRTDDQGYCSKPPKESVNNGFHYFDRCS